MKTTIRPICRRLSLGAGKTGLGQLRLEASFDLVWWLWPSAFAVQLGF